MPFRWRGSVAELAGRWFSDCPRVGGSECRIGVLQRNLGVDPPDLDAQIEAAASEAGMTYSAWLAATARKEFTI